MTKRRTAKIWVPGPHDGPASPLQLPRRSLWSAVRRSFVEFNGDNAWDWAAAMTYYGVLSVFPGLLVVVSIVGLVRPAAMGQLIAGLSDVAPGPVRTIINEAVGGLQNSPRQAGIFAVIGVVVALWSASGYAAAFIRAANAAYDVPEGRPIWKTLSIRMGVTIVTGILLVASATIVVLTGNLASVVGRVLGLESQVITAWGIGKWPVLVVLVSLMFALLYWASPNAQQGGFRWVSPGCMIAVVLWMVASAGFGLYAAHFGSYDKTYGTLAGIVVFLTWLWITNLALLLGLEIDAELERQRAIAAGLPRDAEPYMRLRDEPAHPGTNGSPGLAGRSRQNGSDAIAELDPPAAETRRPRGATMVVVGFMLGLVAGVAVMRTGHRRRSPRCGHDWMTARTEATADEPTGDYRQVLRVPQRSPLHMPSRHAAAIAARPEEGT
jgi:membrane protein